MWPSIRCNRMSCASVDASTFPATWKLRAPLGSSDTATEWRDDQFPGLRS